MVFTNILVDHQDNILHLILRYYTLINEELSKYLGAKDILTTPHLLRSQKGKGNIFLHVIAFIANLKYCLHSRNSPALVYSILVTHMDLEHATVST